MEITILPFGQLTDIINESKLIVSDSENTQELMQRLLVLYPKLNTVKFVLAVNKKIVQKKINLNSGDVVALLPPFSGG